MMMNDRLVLEVTFPTGVTRAFTPAMHPDVAIEVQAAELRAYIYRCIRDGAPISVEVALPSGERAQQVFPPAQVASIAVAIRAAVSGEADEYRARPRHRAAEDRERLPAS